MGRQSGGARDPRSKNLERFSASCLQGAEGDPSHPSLLGRFDDPALEAHLSRPRYSDNPVNLSYTFTEAGRRWMLDALDRLAYTGPAPVTAPHFEERFIDYAVDNLRVKRASPADSTEMATLCVPNP